MSSNDDPANLSPQAGTISSPHINPNCPNLTDLDDIDDDDEGIDDDGLESLDDIQQILQTFGTNDSSTLTIDYFDSRRYEIMYEIMNVEKQFVENKQHMTKYQRTNKLCKYGMVFIFYFSSTVSVNTNLKYKKENKTDCKNLLHKETCNTAQRVSYLGMH